MEKKAIAFSVFLGLLITVATYFLYNSYVIGEFPNVRFVSIPLIGVGYWGFPLPWLKQIVYPGATKEIIWSHFIIDLLFWIAVVFVAKLFYLTHIKGVKLKRPRRAKRRKRKPKRKRRPRRRTRRSRRR